MKSFDIDWREVFRFVPKWCELSRADRRLLLDVPLSGAIDVEPGAHAESVARGCELGVLETFREGERVRATRTDRPTLKALRAMGRFEVTRDASPSGLHEYLVSTLDATERECLWDQPKEVPWERRPEPIEQRVARLTYPENFLDAESKTKWLKAHHDASFGAPPTLAAARDLERLLRRLMERSEPLALAELVRDGGGLTNTRLAIALRTGLRHAFILAALDPDLNPEIAVPPSITRRLHQPKLAPPPAVAVTESHVLPPLAEDLVTLLVFVSEPARLRVSDSSLYAKAEKDLMAQLTPMPASLADQLVGNALENRIWRARHTAEQLRLIVVRGARTKNMRLELTEMGREWLGKSPLEQLLELLEPDRAALLQGDASRLKVTLGWQYRTIEPYLSELRAAFQQLDEPRDWAGFLEFQSVSNNPLLRDPKLLEKDFPGELEESWSAALDAILQRLLLPHAGVSLSPADGGLAIELTDRGRFMLGFTDELVLDTGRPDSAVLVQADFEVIFLSPDPQLEAQLAPFAERIGQNIGALFRLTRSSVQAGARAGLSIELLFAALEAASRAPLPTNVVNEAQAWSEAVRTIDWQRPFVLRCPDEETALKILDTSSRYLERIGGTLLLLIDDSKRAQVTKACAKLGVFLGAPPDEPSPRRKKKRRSRWRSW